MAPICWKCRQKRYGFFSAMKARVTRTVEFAPIPLQKERLECCRQCAAFFLPTTSCKKCGCFLYEKIKHQKASCPLDAW